MSYIKYLILYIYIYINYLIFYHTYLIFTSLFIGCRLCADLWDPRNGCLDAWMLVFVRAWWQIWQECGLHFEGLWTPVLSLGMVPASLW